MTNRGQIIRSSTKGAVPAAGTRAGGELWTNFPDLQLGVIDTARNAQKLLAVRYFSTGADYAAGDYVIQAGQLYRARVAVTAGAFTPSQWTITGGSVLVSATAPATPTPGDMWFDSNGGQLYVFYDDGNTQQWVVAVNQNVAGGVYLPLGGGTMSGDIVSGTVPNPTTAKGIANKGYVDAGDNAIMAALSPVVMGDNRLVNGDMRIDQRNNGASGTAAGYTVDRWQYGSTQASKITWQRGGGPGEFPYALSATTTAAVTPATGDIFYLYQPIEADMVSDFQWGTANAKTVTLSFTAFSTTVSGTFGGAVRNAASNRSYPFSYSLVANVWTRITIIIPGDTAGTWVMSGNAGSLILDFDLGSGATFRAPASAWAAGNFVGANGAVNSVATAANTFAVTGVKLEVGSVATPFNRQSLAKSLADCQRYYQTVAATMRVLATGAANYDCTVTFPTMRAGPTSTPLSLSTANVATATLIVLSANSARHEIASAAAGDAYSLGSSFSLSAEL